MTTTFPELGHFTGSQTLYRLPLFGGRYTEGLHYIAESGATWMLTDILAQVTLNPKLKGEEFLAIKWEPRRGLKPAKLTYEDGNGEALETQEYELTDCEANPFTMFWTGGVLMLAQEY